MNFIHYYCQDGYTPFEIYVIAAVAVVLLPLPIAQRTTIIFWLCRALCDHEEYWEWNDDESALECDVCGHEEWLA